jgi:hypothetical protein
VNDETENPALAILKDLQARMGRIEERMGNLALRMSGMSNTPPPWSFHSRPAMTQSTS